MRADVEPTAEPVEVELPEGRPRTTLDLAAAKLRTALEQRSGYVIVTAETSERSEALFSSVEPRLRTFRTLRVSGQALDPEAIVRALWRDDDVPFPARLAMRTLIDEARAAAQPIVVAITDADGADPARLERVRLTLEGTPDASEIVHVALLGGPALVEWLRRPDARAVTMRIGATVQVPSVTADLAAAARAPVGRTRRAVTLGIAALAATAATGAWFAWQSPVPASRPPAPTAAAARDAVPPSPAPVAAVATRAEAAPPSREVTTPPAAPSLPDVTTPPAAPSPPDVTTPAASPHEAVPPSTPSPRDTAPPPDKGQMTPSSAPPVAAPVPPPSEDAVPTIVPAPAVPAATPSRGAAKPSRGDGGTLQVGAFVSAASADALRARLAPRFPGVAVSKATRDGTTYHRVRIAGFANARELDAAARALRASGYTPVRVKN